MADRSTSLDEFGWSARVRHCFENDGLFTVGDVIDYGARALMRMPNFGRKSLREVEEVLHGLLPEPDVWNSLRLPRPPEPRALNVGLEAFPWLSKWKADRDSRITEKANVGLIGYAVTGEPVITYYTGSQGIRAILSEMMDTDGINRIMIHHLVGSQEPLEVIRQD